jgi:hypothetical protein
MKFDKARLLIILFSLIFLASCYEQIYMIALPEKKEGEYFVGKMFFRDWGRQGGIIKLFDQSGTPLICEAKYTVMLTSSTCSGKRFKLNLKCTDKKTIDFELVNRDCTDAYGVAVDNLGNNYEVYFGVYDDILRIQRQRCSLTNNR